MHDSWKQWKSDNISWQNILTSSYNLQNQWHVVSMRYHETTNELTRKVGFKGTPKLDPYWKSQPVTRKVNTEWKSELNLWTTTVLTRWSVVTDLIDKEYDDNEQETSTTKTEAFAIASRCKAKATPRRPSTTCSSSKIIPILERTWIDIEPGTQIDQACPVSKRMNTLLGHGELPREDGAIEFWRLKDDLRNRFRHVQYWSDDVWKKKMAGSGSKKKRF